MAKRPTLFYGWVIVGITVVSMMLIYGIRHSFSVFFPPILDEFGWSRGSTAFMLSLNLLLYGFTAPFAGSLGDRWKPYRVMPLGVVILGGVTALSAFASELWHFYLLVGILMPIGSALCGWPLLAPALANWFAERRGLAAGLGQMGAGLSFAYGMYAEFAISQLGWRGAYFILGGTLVAIVLPLYLLLFQYRPENKGLRAYGAEAALIPTEEARPESATTRNKASADWTLGQAMRTYQLWMLMLAYFLFWGIGTYLVLAHQVKFAEDVGYSSIFAASIFALFGVFLVAGGLSAWISDSIGREMTITLSVALIIGALITFVSVRDTSQPWLLYIYAACFGYGVGFFSPTITAGAADIFHGKHFGAIAGILLTGMGAGGIIGPWLGGFIHDVTGSYQSAFILSIVCFALSCVAFWIAAPRKAARLHHRAGSAPI
jgi:MFS family permease